MVASGFVTHSSNNPKVDEPKLDTTSIAEASNDKEENHRIQGSKKPEQPHQQLACHFWKRDPHKTARSCCNFRGPIHFVKQHLLRHHCKPPHCCMRCSDTFTSDDGLQEHLHPSDGVLCTMSSVSSNWISSAQITLVKSNKRKPGVTDEDIWFEIWDVLFPNTQRPQSALRGNIGGDVMNAALRRVLDLPETTSESQVNEVIRRVLKAISESSRRFTITPVSGQPGLIEDLTSGPEASSCSKAKTSEHASSYLLDISQNDELEQKRLFNHQHQPYHTHGKQEAPFADSGYASTSKPDASRDVHLAAPRGPQRDTAVRKDAKIDDARTTYSLDTILEVSREQNYIFEACQIIRDNLGHGASPESWTVLSERLAELVKAFAINIGLESDDQANLRVMWFFHKYGERIAKQLVCEDSEAGNRRDDRESTPLEDKMDLWWDEAHCSNAQVDEDRCRDGEDIVLGEDDKSNASGEDNDDEDVGTIEASSHNKIVLESSAFRWLVRNLRNEMALQEDCDRIKGHDSRVVIRKKVLHHLDTGKISKSRSPLVHKVMARLCNWPMITHNEAGRSNHDYTDTRTFDSMVVVCCGGNAQTLSIKQYMKQTWPSTYYQIMSLLQYPSHDHGANAFVVSLPDKTHLVVSAEQSDLVLGISGPAHTIAECIEQLAWVLAALYFPLGYSDGITQHGPIISEPQMVLNDPTDRILELMQPPPRDEHYPCFDINVVASDQALVSADQSKLISAFSGRHVMVPGYPILRRSAACIGIEITPEYVLKLWEGLVLVQQKTGVYLWHGNREPHQVCNCRPEGARGQYDLRTFDDLKNFLSSRHFMRLCNTSGQLEASSWELQSVFDASQRGSSVDHSCFACRSQAEECGMEDRHSNMAVEDIDDSSGYLSIPDQGQQTFKCTSSGVTDSSFDSDWLPPSIVSAEVQPRFSDSPIRDVLPIAISRLLSDFQSAAGGQGFTNSSENNTSRLTASSNSSSTAFSSQGSLKQKRGSNDNPDSDDERPMKRPVHLPSPELPPSNCFACPFFKVAPERYESCLSLTLRRIGDVKQHLSRAHKRPFSCRICLALFPTKKGLQDHTPRNAYSCQQAPPDQEISPLEGYSELKALELSRKSKKSLGQAERWFVMWDILFPGYPHPRSPYLDLALSKQVKSLCDYARANGPSIILQELERNEALQQLCTNGQSEILREAMGHAVQLMIEESCVSLFSGVIPATSQPSHIPKPPSLIRDVSCADAASASSADSGVAMMASSATSGLQIHCQHRLGLNSPRQHQDLTTLTQAQAVIRPPSLDDRTPMGTAHEPDSATSGDLDIPEHYAETQDCHIQEGEGALCEIGQDDRGFQLNTIDTWDELEDFSSFLDRMLEETAED